VKPDAHDGGSVFKITDGSNAPGFRNIRRIATQFPQAHGRAYEETVALAHEHLSQVAAEEGWDPEALYVHLSGSDSHIGIIEGQSGDQLFDGEYGSPEEAPRAVLRGASEALGPELADYYSEALQRHLGA
jgi:hypothetical protein